MDLVSLILVDVEIVLFFKVPREVITALYSIGCGYFVTTCISN